MKMNRLILLSVLVFAIMLVPTTTVFAATTLPASTSCVAHCATTMGGQHVASHAITMDQGISMCARMSHADCSHHHAN